MLSAQATEDYFRSWEGTYAGGFLHRSLNHLRANASELIDLAPSLSGGEQVYAAVWYELYTGRAAPWIPDGQSALAMCASHLDHDLFSNVVGLVAAAYTAQLHK